MYISTGWSVWVIYVLKYIRHWGLNFKFLSKRQHYYITENRIIQKRTKNVPAIRNKCEPLHYKAI